jgi:hypothetical protein
MEDEMDLGEYIQHMQDMRIAYKILVGKPERK